MGTEFIFVNGINTTPETYEYNKSLLTTALNSEVTDIYNQTQGISSDVLNSIRGMTSASAGQRAEFTAVSNLIDRIISGLKKGHEVVIYSYSQGSIITKNALMQILEHGGSLASFIKDKIKIITLGAAVHCWPKDLAVESYAGKNDLIAKTTFGLDKLLSDTQAEQLVEPKWIDNQYPGVAFGADPMPAHMFYAYAEHLAEK